MNFVAYFALLGWPLVALLLCATQPPRRAVILSVLAAWLFLPTASLPIPGLPDWTKMTATCVGLFVGLMIFDFPRLIAFRPRWVDLPMAVWCLTPVATSISNDLGLYDGFSTSLAQVITWGLPYLLGRLYFSDPEALRKLALGVFIAGVVYIPLCLLEVRISPQLHRLVYGFSPYGYEHALRFGGWRPSVFMEHGLMVGMWMSMASLVGLWLWSSGTVRTLRGIPVGWFVIPLVVTAVLCKSAGALVLMTLGLLVLLSLKYRSAALLYALAALAPVYVGLRTTGIWTGSTMVEISSAVSKERAASLRIRLDNEDLLADKALRRPILGWGAWGRSRVSNEAGSDISITDGLWIIEFGLKGLVGLAAMMGVFLMPLRSLSKFPRDLWIRPEAAAVAALATVSVLYLIDCMANAMINPVYTLAAGGIAGAVFVREPVPAEPEVVTES